MAERSKMQSVLLVDEKRRALRLETGKKLGLNKIYKTPGSRIKFCYRGEWRKRGEYCPYAHVLYVAALDPIVIDYEIMSKIIIGPYFVEVILK